MKVNLNISGFDVSANGMSVQRKKMNIIAENIANAEVRNEKGDPYKRKFIDLVYNQDQMVNNPQINNSVALQTTRGDHMKLLSPISTPQKNNNEIQALEKVDNSEGETMYMPDNPNADENGYVQMSNVNIITEMVDMIAASRNYEANLTSFNSAKQIAKDSLEI